MSILSNIARKIKGNPCERLVKQTGTEVAVTGTSFGVGTFKIDVGNFANKIKEFYKVPQIMVALDTSQYLLCGAIREIKDNASLKEDSMRIRMQLILAFSNLQAILSVPTPTKILSKELVRWVRNMNKLNKESIELLKPGPRMISKGKKSQLSRISRYQGIDEEHMEEALNILRENF
ncbi:MAG: hypothetical protein ACFFCW_25315 [Candidatus Hodarchaeota archaeon]